MSQHGRYMIRGGIEGRERLRVIARALHPSTSALLDRIGVRPGMNCLDVGAGGGDVALELARRVGPAGHVLGIDIDDTKLALARDEAAAAGVSNVEYRNLDLFASDVPFTVDLVYARFLLTHLTDAGEAASRLVSAARAGGHVIVEDIDYAGSFVYPDSEAYQHYCELYTETARARGGDPYIGRRLPTILRGAGCDDVHVNIVQPAALDPSGTGGDVKVVIPLTLENVAEAAVAEGLAEREEIDALVDRLYGLAADPGTLMGFPRIVQAWGRRPVAGSAPAATPAAGGEPRFAGRSAPQSVM
jgi:SAM-dependent methyltransferase